MVQAHVNEHLESLDLDLQYQKVSKDNLNLNKQSSLFEDSSYKFINDAYFTYKNLQDHEYDFSLILLSVSPLWSN